MKPRRLPYLVGPVPLAQWQAWSQPAITRAMAERAAGVAPGVRVPRRPGSKRKQPRQEKTQ